MKGRVGSMRVGAKCQNGCEFTVWAPLLDKVAVEIVNSQGEATALLPMHKDDRGYWHAASSGLKAGTLYRYQIEDEQGGEASWPDPASRYQPQGVHGPSEVVDHSEYDWQDSSWQGIPLYEYIIYELHIATFTPEGTFESAIARLQDLVDLGITAIEIMPVAQFPGTRNWGYDGVFPYAVQNSYGGPTGLKKLVDACHAHGLAVVMDVVYNHLGPEGNYTGKYGPYTTDRYVTPWGSAINFDDAYSDGVRNYFIRNAIDWLRDYHIDALRLDAVHAIYDFSAKHFLQELAESVDRFNDDRDYRAYLIAESDLNDPRLIRPFSQGGYQLDSQWSDDFHHALHTRLTGETVGYYSDFSSLEMLASAIQERFAYNGQYSSFRRRNHGSPALDLPSYRFVVCNQNHDQVGNRMMGDRFTNLISFDGLKLAAGMTILSPYIPLLFMGEEYGEKAPFLYFVDHGDKDLMEAVRRGRKEEFRAFHNEGTPPDPGSPETMRRSTLSWPTDSETQLSAEQAILYRFYKFLFQVRRDYQIMDISHHPEIEATHNNDLLYYTRVKESGDLLCLANFGEVTEEVDLPLGDRTWHRILSSSDSEWSVDKKPVEDSHLPEKVVPEDSSVLAIPSLSIVLYQAEPI